MKIRLGFFLPSIGHILFISLFLTLSVAGKGLLNDSDTGWHIQTGNIILNTLSIPKHDIFSFAPPHHVWMNHDWLSQVILALIHRSFGLTGVVVFFSFLISLIYYLLFKMLRKSGVNIIFTVLILLLAIMSSSLNLLARPNVISLLLFVIWYYILDTFQYSHKNYLYLLAPMMLMWANLHGGFIFGFILIGIYFLEIYYKLFCQKGPRKHLIWGKPN